MGRARGANARLNVKFETAYGTPPSGNYIQLPFVSANIGPEQGLIESDLLGQGREGYDPTLDVINNDGDITVPVDARAFGHWLNLLLGAGRPPRGRGERRHCLFGAAGGQFDHHHQRHVFTFGVGRDRQPDQHRRDLSDTLDNAWSPC
jgi:hypothetical protein